MKSWRMPLVNGHLAVFITLAVAAFLTAFYTMRQITLTFLGEPRTKEAEHAQETPWTMTVPLVILAVFAVGYGWVGIPEHFPVLGGLLPNWFHEFVGGTLIEHPEALAFNLVPLLTSLVVALGGLFFGWLVYRKVEVRRRRTSLQIPLLKNKYYFDEILRLPVRPPGSLVRREVHLPVHGSQGHRRHPAHHRPALPFSWVMPSATTSTSRSSTSSSAMGRGMSSRVPAHGLRKIQTGRIQHYMVVSIAVLVVVALLYYFLYFLLA